jgi:hypothetical protein
MRGLCCSAEIRGDALTQIASNPTSPRSRGEVKALVHAHPASAVSASRTQYDVPTGIVSSLKS